MSEPQPAASPRPPVLPSYCVAALALLLVALGDTGTATANDSWFPLDEGTHREYAIHRDRVVERRGKSLERQFFHGRSQMRVIASEGRLRRVQHLDMQREAMVGATAELRNEEIASYSSSAGGVFLHEQSRPESGTVERYDPPLAFLPLPLREGRSWDVGTLRNGALSIRAKAKVVRREALTIDGHTFEDVAHIRFSGPVSGQLAGGPTVSEGTFSDDLWLARGVGPVRRVTTYEFRFDDPEDETAGISEQIRWTLDGSADLAANP